MGVSDTKKYPEIRAIFGMPKDEPLFILRGQDQVAIPTVACYQAIYDVVSSETYQYRQDFHDHLDAVISNFNRWKTRNKEKVKVPD